MLYSEKCVFEESERVWKYWQQRNLHNLNILRCTKQKWSGTKYSRNNAPINLLSLQKVLASSTHEGLCLQMLFHLCQVQTFPETVCFLSRVFLHLMQQFFGNQCELCKSHQCELDSPTGAHLLHCQCSYNISLSQDIKQHGHFQGDFFIYKIIKGADAVMRENHVQNSSSRCFATLPEKRVTFISRLVHLLCRQRWQQGVGRIQYNPSVWYCVIRRSRHFSDDAESQRSHKPNEKEWVGRSSPFIAGP